MQAQNSSNNFNISNLNRNFPVILNKNENENSEVENKEQENFENDKILKRWSWFWEQRSYPSYKIPDINHYYDFSNKRKITIDKPLTSEWSFIGPEQSSGGLNGLGRVNVIRTDPKNENIIWAGAASGGLWKSTNGGESWNTNTDNFASLGISDIVIQPNNSKIMYVATGDADAVSTFSIGVLKSTDGGNSWEKTGLTYKTSELVRIYRLVMHPSNNNILFTAGSNGINKTTDGGKSWTQIVEGLFYDLEFKPNDPKTMYAVGTKFYQTTDGGNFWQEISNGWPQNNITRVSIAVTPIAPNNVYALCSNNEYGFGGFYVSTNSGYTWQNKASTPNILGLSVTGSDNGGQGWYDLCLAVSPIDANSIYAGGINVWHSSDGGLNWKLETNWYPTIDVGTVHADHHNLWFVDNSTTLFSANDGGVYRKRFNAQWEWIGSGMGITQFYRLSGSATDSSKIIAGCQDNGTKLKDGNQFKNIRAGDGMDCLIDYSDDNIMYASIPYGTLLKSTNNGRDFVGIKPPGSYGSWVAPFVQHPSNPEILFAGLNEVYKSTNRGDSWTIISNFQIADKKALNFISVSQSNPNIIFTAQGSGIFKKTTDGGNSWQDISKPVDLWLTSIAIHPHNPNIVYISFSGYVDGEKIYRSTDGGNTWENISRNLPNVPFNTIVVEKNSPDRIYAGCDIGVYYIDKYLDEWQEFSDGLPNTVISDLDIQYSSHMLRAATYGRGLWQAPLVETVLNTAIHGDTTVCSNSESFYYTDSFYGLENEWQISGGEILNNNTSDTIYVDWQNNNTGKLKLIQRLPSANKSDSTTINVQIIPRPVAEINGLDSICNNSVFVYSTDDKTNQKKWSVTGGSIVGSDTNKNVRIFFHSDSNAVVKLALYSGLSGCADSISKLVTLHHIPKPEILGSDTVCALSKATYNGDFTGKYIPIWKVEGGEITSNQGKSINVNWTDTSKGKIILTILDENTGCKDSTKFTVIILPKPDLSVNGEFSPCINTNVSYTTQAENSYKINWDIEGGRFESSDSSANITVVWEQTGNHTLTLIKTNTQSDCIYDTSFTIAVKEQPKPSVSGIDNICLRQTTEYSADKIDNNSIIWKVKGGEISGSNTDSIVTVNWTESGIGYVKLIMTNLQSSCTDSSEFKVIINPLPEAAFSGVYTVCPDCTEKYIVINPNFKNKWQIAGGTLQTNSDADTAIVLWGNEGKGTIKLVQTDINTFCTDSTEEAVTITNNAKPGINGPNKVCFNNINHYTTTSSIIYKNQWSVVNGTIQDSDTNYYVDVKWTQEGKAELKLEQINTQTTLIDTFNIKIDINPIPQKPIIEREGIALRSNVPVGNQWYLDNKKIAGETGQYYFPSQNGIYKVRIQNEFTCYSEFSDEYKFIISSIEFYKQDDWTIYPNPAEDYIEIKGDISSLASNGYIKVYNLLGEIVIKINPSTSVRSNRIRIDISSLTQGMYYINTGRKILKFVKL